MKKNISAKKIYKVNKSTTWTQTLVENNLHKSISKKLLYGLFRQSIKKKWMPILLKWKGSIFGLMNSLTDAANMKEHLKNVLYIRWQF